MRLLVVANAGIDSDEVLNAIVMRASEGAVHVTLVEPAVVGGSLPSSRPGATAEDPGRAGHTATTERLERAVQQLRAAGVPAEGVVGGDLVARGRAQDDWDPSGFDEVVVSCRPWLSFTRDVFESDSAAP